MRKLILFITLCGLLAAYTLADNTPLENKERGPTEIFSLRTENSETFDNHDGTRTTKVYTNRKFYNDAGVFREIDLTVKEQQKEGFSYVVEAGSYTYRFDPSSKAKGHSFSREGYYVTYVPAGNWTGITSTVTPTTEGIKEEITFGTEADSSVSWTIITNAKVTFENEELTFKDSMDTFLFRIPRIMAWDSRGVNIPVSISYSSDTLSYSLSIPDNVSYPIILDPSTTIGETDDKTGYCFQTSGTYSTARNASSGSFVGTVIKAGQNTSYRVQRGIYVFDTSSLPESIQIDSAKVFLTVEDDQSITDFDMKLVQPTFTGDPVGTWYNDFSGWHSGAGVYYVNNYSNMINSSSISGVGDTLRFELTSIALDSIYTEGETRFVLLSNEDINESMPAANEYVEFEDDSPYIEIWYSSIVRPTNFTMTALDSVTIVCSWEDNSNEDKFYIINWADSSVVDSTAANAVADTINGLNWNTKYIWAVVADSSGTKWYSVPDSTYTLLAPPNISDITIMPISSDTLRITVTEPSNGTSGNTGMEVSAVSGPGATGSGWLTGEYSYCDGGLNPDSVYVYKVRYRNADGVATDWSPNVQYTMNGLDTLYVYLAGDSYDDYNVNFGSGAGDSTVVRVGSSDSGERLDGFLSFEIPWQVYKGGVDSLYLSMTRAEEESLRTPTITLYGILVADIEPIEELDVGAQDSTSVTVSWTTDSGIGPKVSPDLRILFRAWQDVATHKGPADGFGIRLDDGSQADSVRVVFLDYSHQSYTNGTSLTIYYTPGVCDSLDGAPGDFSMTVLGPDSLEADWTDNSTTEHGYILCNLADSSMVAGVDSLDENTTGVNVGGLTPNTLYQWFVKAYTAIDEALSESSSARTQARVPGKTTVTAISESSIHFVLDPKDNTSWTKFAVQDSLSGKYVDATAEPDTLRAGSLGEWGWRTYTQWGAASGDTLSGLKPDSLYVIRAKARSEE